uniref:Condensin complex subunit 1 C-terminal domain-containing protein n=1 Tax=Mucochytrium quahogii TaxID=96639 RepID=A0A7S2REY1_9STRA|mmetsp:Transcript_14114/g.30552  ORF Transcript_14114/g.30552 Transcript_14114/m.30552 type:complete len:1146 (+) Transcript_14114:78-3515(+)
MSDFGIPLLSQSIRDLELVSDDSRVRVVDVVDLDESTEKEQRGFVQRLRTTLLDNDCASRVLVEDQSCLDGVYSLVRYFEEISTPVQGDVVEFLCELLSAIGNDLEGSDEDFIKSSLKFTVYLCGKLVITQEGKGKWENYRLKMLTCLSSTVKSGYSKLWACGVVEESFLDIFWKTAEAVVSQSPKLGTNGDTSLLLQDLVCVPLHNFPDIVSHTIVGSFSHSLCSSDGMVSFVTSVIKRLCEVYEDDRFGKEMILEVGRFDTHDPNGSVSAAKNMGIFIESLASNTPSLVLSNLSVLVPHLNAHAHPTRSCVLRALGSLIAYLKQDNEAMKDTRDQLLDLVGERGHDTSSYVRAVAISVFTSLCEKTCLPVSHLQIAVEIAMERVVDKSSLVRKQALVCLASLLENNPFSDRLEPDFFRGKLESMSQNGEEGQVVAELTYYRSALEFSARMESACQQAERLVCSKNVTDVLESLRFLSTAVRFKLPAASDSMRKLLRLVWDDRESGRVQKELLETFELIYISTPGDRNKRILYNTQEICDNLINMVAAATLSELTSLEKIVNELTNPAKTLKRLVIPSVVVEQIWTRATSGKNDRESCAAMCLVSMCTSETSTFFEKNGSRISTLLDVASNGEYQITQYAFMTLRNIFSRADGERFSEYFDQVTDIVTSLVVDGREGDSNITAWYPAAEKGMNLLPFCNTRVDKVFARTLRRMHKRVFGTDAQQNDSQMSRFFFVVGHAAIKVYVFADHATAEAKKLRRQRQENQANELEEMLGGTDGDDYEENLLKRVANIELVGKPDQSFLGMYVPCMVRIVKESLKNVDEPHACLLAASLSLLKVMCVSEKVCEANLALVFTLLRDCKNPEVRSNIMIAMGDLAVRFPNTVEPFNSQIYRSLRDPDVGVRKTSLMVLTHLILNDMIKVRGEISEIALCLEDEDSERIRDLTALFFHELSRKGTHPIYNLLPDTIAKLSKEITSKAKFQRITTFLAQFIVLEKHIAGTLEKLCNRIYAATGLRAEEEELASLETFSERRLCQDLAFCVSLLKVSSEKTVKLLADPLFKLYKPLLADDEVYNSFGVALMKKAKQFVSQKPDATKQLVEEWNERLQESRTSQKTDQETTNKARKRKAKVSRKKKTNDENQAINI